MSTSMLLAYLYPAARAGEMYDLNGDAVRWWDAALLGPQPSAEALAAAASSPEYAAWLLDAARRARMEKVYARTRELEAQGFTFAGLRFGLTGDTQVTWLTLLVAAMSNMVTLPKPVGILDDGTYEIPDLATLQAFCAAALARGEYLKGEVTMVDGQPVYGEAGLRKLVFAAETPEAVAAVQDTRE